MWAIYCKFCLVPSTSLSLKAARHFCVSKSSSTELSLMRIDSKGALTLAAFIRNSLEALDRIESRVSQYNIGQLSDAELDSLGYSLHNIYNALENCFEQISLSFENHVRDRTRWHRELLGKMFLDIKPLRPAVLPDELRSVLGDLLGFRHLFRHAYEFKIDQAKTIALWNRWLTDNASVKQSLTDFAEALEQIGSES